MKKYLKSFALICSLILLSGCGSNSNTGGDKGNDSTTDGTSNDASFDEALNERVYGIKNPTDAQKELLKAVNDFRATDRSCGGLEGDFNTATELKLNDNLINAGHQLLERIESGVTRGDNGGIEGTEFGDFDTPSALSHRYLLNHLSEIMANIFFLPTEYDFFGLKINGGTNIDFKNTLSSLENIVYDDSMTDEEFQDYKGRGEMCTALMNPNLKFLGFNQKIQFDANGTITRGILLFSDESR